MESIAICALLLAAPAAPSREQVHRQAMVQYKKAEFHKAAELFAAELELLEPVERGTEVEQTIRERLVLSLYSAERKDEAADAYRALRVRFPSFRFDQNRIAPSTFSFFAKIDAAAAAAPPVQPAPVVQGTPPAQATPPMQVVKAAPGSEPVSPTPRVEALAPREIVVTPPRWHWYYLTPLGIGQFLARSPVRGALFLIGELGFAGLNVAGYLLYHPQIAGDGGVRDVRTATMGQLMMNIGFFGLIATAAIALFDSLFFEPQLGGVARAGGDGT
jgi:hypothetical protein